MTETLVDRLRAGCIYDPRETPADAELLNESETDDLLIEAADRIEQLERRYECHYSEATEADLGRAFRAFARKVEAFSGAEWVDEGERRLGLMNMGLMAVVKMAAESNAETFTATYEGFTICGAPMGDWTVTVSRKQSEPRP